jgi:hypothetical protein
MQSGKIYNLGKCPVGAAEGRKAELRLSFFKVNDDVTAAPATSSDDVCKNLRREYELMINGYLIKRYNWLKADLTLTTSAFLKVSRNSEPLIFQGN